jgi:hypothetical protein
VTINATKKHVVTLTFMLDDDISPHALAQEIATKCGGNVLRSDEALAVLFRAFDQESESREAAADLPPDAPTGLYLDRPFDVDDLEWITMAWAAYLSRGEGPPRPFQLMLVFKAIRRDERAVEEFLRVMNTIVLPLCRRLRLQEQPNLRDLGAAK